MCSFFICLKLCDLKEYIVKCRISVSINYFQCRGWVMSINIRKLKREDKNAFIDLSLGLTEFNTKYNKENRPKKDNLEERLKRRREKIDRLFEDYWTTDNQLIIVATLSNKVVGYAIAYIYDEVYGYLDEMYVSEDSRGIGLGKKLLDTVSQELKTLKVEKLKLNVFLWNENAIKLYDKEGFHRYFVGYIKDL